MPRVHFVQLDLGGTVEHRMVDVPADGARWDATPAPTVQLYSDSGGELLSSPATATEGPSTTLSADAAAGATSVSVASTTGIDRFDEMLVGPSSDGRWEWITVMGAGGGQVHLAAPLEHSYSSGDVVKSHTLTYTIAASDAASVARGCRAEWRYEVGGVERRESTVYHVSRYAPRMSLTAAGLAQEYPRALRQVASHQDLDLLIRRVWEGHVLPAIGRIYAPGAMVSGELAEQALIAAVKTTLAEEAKDLDAAEIYRDQYRAHMDEIASLMVGLVDTDEDGVRDDDETPRGALTPIIMRG